jgi:GT2 family glycosyltransferase
MNPQVIALILNYNRAKDTIECVISLKESIYKNLEIIVIDNGSTDGSESIIRAAHQDITIIQTGCNLGFCGGNNFGIRYILSLSRCPPYILLLNNDTLVEPDFLVPMVEAMESDEKAAATGGTICYYPNKEKVWYAGGRFVFWRASSFSDYSGKEFYCIRNIKKHKVTFITGCLMLIRSEVLKTIGLLDEKFFMYFEDAELSLRLIKAGFHLLYIPQTRIYHKIENRVDQPLSLYFSIRNRLLFINKVTYGIPRIIATIYFLVVTFSKMAYWRIRKPILYKVACYGLEDYRKKVFYEGRGLSIDVEEEEKTYNH